MKNADYFRPRCRDPSYSAFLTELALPRALVAGSGFVQFTLAPVPEPGTLTLLALGALALRRRAERRRTPDPTPPNRNPG